MNDKKTKNSRIQSRLITYIWICIFPFILFFGFAIFRLLKYYQSNDQMVRNITSANEYNMDFKNSMDEMMYKIIIGSANWTDSEKKLEALKKDMLSDR